MDALGIAEANVMGLVKELVASDVLEVVQEVLYLQLILLYDEGFTSAMERRCS